MTPSEEGLTEMAPNGKFFMVADTQTFAFFCVLFHLRFVVHLRDGLPVSFIF